MLKVEPAEFERNLDKYQDIALSEPVAVTGNGQDGTVLISLEEYRRLTHGQRKVMSLADFTEEDIEAIENVKFPASAAAFDDEVED